MSQTFPVLRLTQEAYNALRIESENNPNMWMDPNADFHGFLVKQGITQYTEETLITSNQPIDLVPAYGEPRNRQHRADHQALDFYNSLNGMTPSLATEGLIWTWMTHFKLHSYSLERWPHNANTNLVNHIRRHWFVENQTDAIRQNNTAGRTWWIAHTATKAAEDSGGAFTAQDALYDFANTPRHYHNMMNSNISRNPLVLAEFTRSLLNEAEGISGIGSDQIWKRMNLAAGTMLLDAMPRETLRSHIKNHLEEIMSDPEYVSDRTKLRNRKPFQVLSLGAGVQSSCLALMAERGEYGLTRPDIAIFADTGWEPPAVYDHLEWLKSQLSYEVVVVDNGNIRDNILEGKMPNGSNFLGIPAYITNPDGSKGILRRQCTSYYKTDPIHRHLRQILELTPGRRAPKDVQVEMWLGISVDEAVRQKPGKEEWVTKRYPLMEQNLSRAQLYNWFKTNYPDRNLPSSSCIGCPYHNDSMWKNLKEKDPQSFQDAVFIDRALRDVPAIRNMVNGTAYLHKSRIPLSEVDFSYVTDYDDLMLEECEGLCGI